jgi:hypothetical protein
MHSKQVGDGVCTMQKSSSIQHTFVLQPTSNSRKEHMPSHVVIWHGPVGPVNRVLGLNELCTPATPVMLVGVAVLLARICMHGCHGHCCCQACGFPHVCASTPALLCGPVGSPNTPLCVFVAAANREKFLAAAASAPKSFSQVQVRAPGGGVILISLIYACPWLATVSDRQRLPVAMHPLTW